MNTIATRFATQIAEHVERRQDQRLAAPRQRQVNERDQRRAGDREQAERQRDAQRQRGRRDQHRREEQKRERILEPAGESHQHRELHDVVARAAARRGRARAAAVRNAMRSATLSQAESAITDRQAATAARTRAEVDDQHRDRLADHREPAQPHQRVQAHVAARSDRNGEPRIRASPQCSRLWREKVIEPPCALRPASGHAACARDSRCRANRA